MPFSGIRVAVVRWLCFTALLVASAQQHSPPNELPDTTADRVTGQGWWPTKSPASTKGYVGSDVCAECHSAIGSTQSESEMAKAAFRLSGGAAGQPASGDFESGSYTYRFIANNTPPGYSLEVTSNGRSISYPIAWTMGVGVHGQTYLLDENGGLYEGQVSSFSFIHRIGLTPGHTPAEEGSLENAARHAAQGRRSCSMFRLPYDGIFGEFYAEYGRRCSRCALRGLPWSRAGSCECDLCPPDRAGSPSHL